MEQLKAEAGGALLIPLASPLAYWLLGFEPTAMALLAIIAAQGVGRSGR